ncbi:MAG TPA: hypothetical protein VEI97_12575, partial [bacterium]|nr:hypothetical protein [bacterium]
MRFPHPALLFLTLGAGLAACNGGDTDGGPIDPGPQPKKRGTITVVGGTEGIHVGEIRTLTEQFEDAGAIRVEWDLDFDGTTFTVDRTLDTPTAGQEPVTLFFGEAGTHTVAMRGVFPEEEFTEIAAVALTVLPPEDPFHFRAVQRELAERTWDPAVGGYASPYVEIVAGDQALARNGRRLLAGYYSLKAGGVLRYYLVASNDLGSTWGPPTVMSAHADDQPFLDKQPEVTIAPLGTEFLVAWISTAGRLHKARVIVPDERAPVPVRGTRDFGPRVPGETAAQLPLLLPHPTNPGVVRLLGAASTADKPNGILSAEEITGDGGPAITSRDLPAIDVSPQRITALEGTWPD